MSNVFIDPYMFYIKESTYLLSAVQFYNDVIELCDQYTIVLDNGLRDKLLKRGTIPFPINLSDIQDGDLRRQVNVINSIFSDIIIHNALPLDIEVCEGEQDFDIMPALENDDKNLFYDIFMLMLRGCYEKSFKIDENILTDGLCGRLNLSTTHVIKCKCDCGEFEQKIRAIEPNKLFSNKTVALNKIRKLLEKIDKCSEPEVIRDQHHNFIQDDEVRKFSDLTRKNKIVLNSLLGFGLEKIHFVECVTDGMSSVGSIRKCKAVTRTKQDEVTGIFHAQTDCKVKVLLYFPEEMGQALCEYTGGEFTQQKILELNREI